MTKDVNIAMGTTGSVQCGGEIIRLPVTLMIVFQGL